jgi:hypothetical protein
VCHAPQAASLGCQFVADSTTSACRQYVGELGLMPHHHVPARVAQDQLTLLVRRDLQMKLTHAPPLMHEWTGNALLDETSLVPGVFPLAEFHQHPTEVSLAEMPRL